MQLGAELAELVRVETEGIVVCQVCDGAQGMERAGENGSDYANQRGGF